MSEVRNSFIVRQSEGDLFFSWFQGCCPNPHQFLLFFILFFSSPNCNTRLNPVSVQMTLYHMSFLFLYCLQLISHLSRAPVEFCSPQERINIVRFRSDFVPPHPRDTPLIPSLAGRKSSGPIKLIIYFGYQNNRRGQPKDCYYTTYIYNIINTAVL